MTEQERPERQSYPYQRRERKGEPPSYIRAARFSGEQPAGQVYEAAQEAVYSAPPNDLSVYRLILQQVYHVAVLGLEPPPLLRRTLENILAAGEPAELAPEVLKSLAERRAQQIRRGSWVEEHHRPGRGI